MVLCQGLSVGNAQVLAFPAAKHHLCFARRPCLRAPAGSLSLKSCHLHAERKSFSARAMRAGTGFVQKDMLTLFQRDDSIKGIPPLSTRHNQRRRPEVSCRASPLASFSYPELTSKPRWWWRTLACVPYLLPLHNMWSYADVIYQLHTYLQGFSLLYTFIDTMTLCPGWLFLVIFMTVYFFVVRRKWSPHFLRFHVILAILLDTGSQAVATMCTWMPSIVYQGKPMQYFWMAIAFIQIFTVLECMRCALAGMYPNVPFISHTAFIHSDLNLFSGALPSPPSQQLGSPRIPWPPSRATAPPPGSRGSASGSLLFHLGVRRLMALLAPAISGEMGLRLLLAPLSSNVVIRTASCAVGIGLPVYSTFRAIENKDQEEKERWLLYWAAYGSFSIAEVFADQILSRLKQLAGSDYVKFAVLGSKHVYRRHVRPFFLKHQAKIDRILNILSKEFTKFVSSHGDEIHFIGNMTARGASTDSLTSNSSVQMLRNGIVELDASWNFGR
ncbi:hypothetical protein ABZP36_000247 [Zizania latifolia]